MENNLHDLSTRIGLVPALEFQLYTVQRVELTFGKYLKLHSPAYYRDSSLDYPLYYSKHAFLSSKTFDIYT